MKTIRSAASLPAVAHASRTLMHVVTKASMASQDVPLIGREPDIAGLHVQRPQRFDGPPRDELRVRALRLYRDIYATA